MPGCLVLTVRQKHAGFVSVGRIDDLFEQERATEMSHVVYIDHSAKCLFQGIEERSLTPEEEKQDTGFLPYLVELKKGYTWMFGTVMGELVSVEMRGGRYQIRAHPTL